MDAELIVDARNAVGECPVWVPEENALYWVDIPNGGLQRWSAASGHIAAWTAPHMLACIARTEAGNWVAGMETGFFQLTPHNDGYQEFHDFDPRELALIEPLRALRLMHMK